jgi:phosphohistidine phosphatase
MKTIYLVRHAKSSWSHPELSDEQRPLLVKGENNTKLLTDYLNSKEITIDLIISSHAIRAFETARIIAAGLKYPDKNIKIDRQIYYADTDGLYDTFYDLPEKIESVMMIGHNPSITYFVNKFIEQKIDNMPTSGLICISLSITKWNNIIKPQSKELFRFFPKHEH